MMEPIGNLEHWTYIDRPDYFAALADEGMDELDKMLAILRWLCTYPVLADHCMTGLTSLYVVTKEVKFVRHPIAKPFNSVLVWIVSPLPLGMRVSVDRLLSLAGRIIPLLLRHPCPGTAPQEETPSSGHTRRRGPASRDYHLRRSWIQQHDVGRAAQVPPFHHLYLQL